MLVQTAETWPMIIRDTFRVAANLIQTFHYLNQYVSPNSRQHMGSRKQELQISTSSEYPSEIIQFRQLGPQYIISNLVALNQNMFQVLNSCSLQA